MNNPVTADDVRFIKLGAKGELEKQCIADGTIRLGYEMVPYEFGAEGKWEEVHKIFAANNGDRGAATRHVNQIRDFYQAPSTWIWITFSGDSMYWCFADAQVTRLDTGESIRKAIGGWHCDDINGKRLTKTRLSGALLAVQGFRGTICSTDAAYVINKINAKNPPYVTAANDAVNQLENTLQPVIAALSWGDFELLVDLLFRNSGWNRIGDLGGIEKDIDLALESPVTGERIAVQVKSRANAGQFEEWKQQCMAMVGFHRFYFVTHWPIATLERGQQGASFHSQFNYWGPSIIAKSVLRNGLAQWLIEKVA
jgi:hypothetical protein